jgi:hypothetical protein
MPGKKKKEGFRETGYAMSDEVTLRQKDVAVFRMKLEKQVT